MAAVSRHEVTKDLEEGLGMIENMEEGELLNLSNYLVLTHIRGAWHVAQ